MRELNERDVDEVTGGLYDPYAGLPDWMRPDSDRTILDPPIFEPPVCK